jgi:hypothetical protein
MLKNTFGFYIYVKRRNEELIAEHRQAPHLRDSSKKTGTG